MVLYRHILCASTAIAICGTAPSAFSQTAASDQGSQSNALGEIIVTARRTDENLQQVPIAASVVSGDELSRQGISTTRDLQFNAPSLVVTPDPLGGTSTPIVQLRGQTAPLGTDNTVVTYFGEIPVDARVIAAGIYDLASVQVIRGPQGTLFGKNSTGGALVFTPQGATADEVKGFGESNVGNYGLMQFTGAINLPIVPDVLAVRFSGQVTRQDGFVENISGPDGNDKHWEAGRVALNFTPGSNFENATLFAYFNGKQRLNPNIPLAIYGPSFFFPAAVAGFALQQQLGPRKFSMPASIAPNNDDNESYLISNVSTYDLGSITFKNIVGYSHSRLNLRMNQPAYAFNQVDVAQDRKIRQFSEEFQISDNSNTSGLKWIVGAFFSKNKGVLNQRSRLFSPVARLFSDSTDRYTSKALFAQASYDFTNMGATGLKLTGGIRHSWDKRVGSSVQNTPAPLTVKSKHVSWTVGLDYQINDDLLVYVASRHSYKAGGFNLISPLLPPSSLIYAPEELTDIEVGVKATVDVGSVPVRANLAAYRGWYKDIQTQATGTCGGLSGQASLIINAGKGSPKGLEFELQAALARNLTVSAFYNRTLGKYDRFIVPDVRGCTIAALPDISGQNFGNIAKDTAGLNAIYTLPLAGNDEELQFSGNVYFRGDRLGNALAGFNSAMPGYTIANARLDYNHIANGPASVGIFVRNLTNKLYAQSRNISPTAGYDVWQFGDPRTYGMSLKVEF